jgi:hypothetical protein
LFKKGREEKMNRHQKADLRSGLGCILALVLFLVLFVAAAYGAWELFLAMLGAIVKTIKSA